MVSNTKALTNSMYGTNAVDLIKISQLTSTLAFSQLSSFKTNYRWSSVRNASNQASSSLTHVNAQSGQSEMVDVGDKQITKRLAVARASVKLGPVVFDLVRLNQMKKGDVLGVSKIAGIQAAKLTSNLIPLCHPLNLNCIKVNIELNAKKNSAEITATVSVDHRTGVEMEALTAVSVAALTIYDMCKAASKDMEISSIRLVHKSGGKSIWNESNDKFKQDFD